MKTFDTIIYIGRFQPFHDGHMETFKQARDLAKRVLFLVGSANVAPDIRNPWSFVERKRMILNAVENCGIEVEVVPLDDYPYNDNAWIEQVQRVARQYTYPSDKIAIIGFNSDHTSYYLDLFPQWEKVEVEERVIIHATDIRKSLFEVQYVTRVPDGVSLYIDTWKENFAGEFNRLRTEYNHIKAYRESWKSTPYPVTFTTVDAVVVQSGHVLLVQRKAAPGEGLWALPGGFISPTERIQDAMVRELREETKLKVPVPVLKGSIKGKEVFDGPDRSLRGRTITHAFYIELNPGELPAVKGSDDAKAAKWISFEELVHMQKQMFEDHYAIIQHFINLKA